MGVESKDIMAKGDNFNDVTMLELAGLSVAMGNAEGDLSTHNLLHVTVNYASHEN